MSLGDSNIVGAYEAKTHFSALLERVAEGQEILITRHGAPIARLIPADAQTTEADRAEAIASILKLGAKNRLKGTTLKGLIAEGRR